MMISKKMLHPVYWSKYSWVLENKPIGKILDIGCGKGEYLETFDNCWGVDIEMLDHPRFIKSSAEELPFSDGEFDTILCMDVLEHLDKPDSAVKEIFRVLKNGGRLILSVPSFDYPWPYDPINKILSKFFNRHIPIGIWAWGHKRLYKKSEIYDLLIQHGFYVEKYNKANFFLVALLLNYIPSLVAYISGTGTGKKHKAGLLFKMTKLIHNYDNKYFSKGEGISHYLVAKR